MHGESAQRRIVIVQDAAIRTLDDTVGRYIPDLRGSWYGSRSDLAARQYRTRDRRLWIAVVDLRRPGGIRERHFGQGIFIDPARRLVIASHANWPRASLGPQPAPREAFYAQVRALIDAGR